MERKSNKENTLSSGTIRPTALGSTVRALTLACATLTTGLVAGVYYAYAVSVNLGLAGQPDASYVATMQAINERIENLGLRALHWGQLLADRFRERAAERAARQRRR